MKSRPTRIVIWLVAVLASLAGMQLSWALTFKHIMTVLQSPAQDTLLERACESTEQPTRSCAKVIESRWGQFPPKDLVGKIPVPPLPTSEWGLFYFTFVFCWLMLIGVVSPQRWGVHLVFAAVTAAGLGVAIFLAYEMYRNLDHWCPLCAVVHGLSLILMICALLLWPRREKKPAPETVESAPPPATPEPGVTPAESAALFTTSAAPAAPTREPSERDSVAWPHWRILAATPFVALIAILAEHYYIAAVTNRTKFENAGLNAARYKQYWEQYENAPVHPFTAWYGSPRVNLAIRPEDPVRGPANAAHTLIVWSDFECPMCGQFEKFVREKVVPLAGASGGIKVVFRNWPLNKACNPNARQTAHKYACDAARAALAAQLLGGNDAFWKMHDLLFERQEKLPTAPYGDWAAEIGLQKSTFMEAMDSPEVKARLQSDIQEGVTLGANAGLDAAQLRKVRVSGTPGIYIDGRKLVSWRSEQVWDWILHGYGIKVVMPSKATQPAR